MGSNPTLSACWWFAAALVLTASSSATRADDAAPAGVKRSMADGERDLRQAFEQSDAVFEGFVHRVDVRSGGAGCSTADVSVVRTWKGADEEHVHLELCGYDAKPQTGHLFFAKSFESERSARGLRVSGGSASQPSEDAGEAFRWLGAGVTPVDRAKLGSKSAPPLKSALRAGRYNRAGCQSCALAAYSPSRSKPSSEGTALLALGLLLLLSTTLGARIARRRFTLRRC